MVDKQTDKTISSEGCFSDATIQALTEGITRLIEVQRLFADEFGLSYQRVFQSDFEPFKDRPPQDILLEWLHDGPRGAGALAQILEDLSEHQVALISGLDGIATQALAELNPRKHKKKGVGVLGVRPMAWKHYKKFHEQMTDNKTARHQQLVLPGFVTHYVQTREEYVLRKSQQQIKTEQKDNILK
jgi:hypothetical protein